MRDLGGGASAEQTGDSGRVELIAPVSGWRMSPSDLGIFWPILLTVLAVAVVLVATVAHRSMDGVGVTSSPQVAMPSRPAATTDAPIMAGEHLIVQVSSHDTRSDAQVAVNRLSDPGVRLHILDSDLYSPLNAGYIVVYAGPFSVSKAGLAAAARVQKRFNGSRIREIRPR